MPPVQNRAPVAERISPAAGPTPTAAPPSQVAKQSPQVLNPPKAVDEPPELEDAPVDSPSRVEERSNRVDDYPSLVDEDPITAGEHSDTVDEDPDAVGEDTDALDVDLDAVDEDPEAVDEDPEAVDEDPEAVDEDPETEEAQPASAQKPGGRAAPSRPAENRTGKDTRRGKRVRVSGIATLETGGLNATNQAVCTVRDLSRSGIGLETGQPPEVGQVVRLRLILNGNMVTLSTIATRVDRRANSNFYVIGLDWSRCKPEELVFLDKALEAVEAPEPVKSKPRR